MDREEFELVVPALRRAIVSTALRLSDGDSSLADDVAQDTLLRLWTMRDRLDSVNSLEAMVTVMARNRTVDLLRSHRPGVNLDAIETVMAVDPSLTPHESMERREESDRLDHVMLSLPTAQQALIRMRHVEGLEIDEIASLTGSTPGAVRTMLTRTRQQIRNLFMQNQDR